MRLGGLLATLGRNRMSAGNCAWRSRDGSSRAQSSDLDRPVASEPRVRLRAGRRVRGRSSCRLGRFHWRYERRRRTGAGGTVRVGEAAQRVGRRHRLLGRGLARRDRAAGRSLFKPDWGPDLLLSTNYLERLGHLQTAARWRGRRLRRRCWTWAGLRSRASIDRAHRSDCARSEGALPQPAPSDDGGLAAGASCGQSRRVACARRGAAQAWQRRTHERAVRSKRATLLHDAPRAEATPAGLDHHPHARTSGRCCRRRSRASGRAPTTTATRSSSSTTRARTPTP